ncbi:MAG: hypothetical protein KKC20_24715 [Proteobacteria bacterium]|nr:hypothetical protein [Pseudomonadota bacterium]
MKKLQKTYIKMLNDTRAISAVEYVLLVAAVAIVIYGGFKIFGSYLNDFIIDAAGKV